MAERPIRLRAGTLTRARYALASKTGRTFMAFAIVAALSAGAAWQWPIVERAFYDVTGLQSPQEVAEREERAVSASRLEMMIEEAREAELADGAVKPVSETYSVLQKEISHSAKQLKARTTATELDDARRDLSAALDAYERAVKDAAAELKKAEEAAAAAKKAADEAAAQEAAAAAAAAAAANQGGGAAPGGGGQTGGNGGSGGGAPAPPPSASRATQSMSMTCSGTESVTISANGGGNVVVTANGVTSSGSGSASVTITVSGALNASASADGSVSIFASATYTCR